MKLTHVEARGGGIEVHAWISRDGLAALRLGEITEAARGPSCPLEGVEVEPGTAQHELAQALRTYLQGEPLEWEGEIDWHGITGFQRAVFEVVRMIPHASIRTYGEVARELGKPQALRAVGNALHRNPFPIVVPCHRIVKEGGQLGGFSSGVSFKRRLIALEAGQTSFPWGDGDAGR